MADEVLSQADLLAAFSANATGDIGGQELRDYVVSAAVYGGVYVQDGADTQSIGTSYVVIDQFTTNGDAFGVTPAFATSALTLLSTGFYLVGYSVSFRPDDVAANSVYTVAIHKGGVRVDGSASALQTVLSSAPSTDVKCLASTWIVSATAGNVVDLRVKASADPRDFNLIQGNFWARRIA